MNLVRFIFVFLFCVPVVSWGAFPLSTDDIGITEQEKYSLETGVVSVRNTYNANESGVFIAIQHGINGKMDMIFSVPFQVEPSTTNQVGTATLTWRFNLIKDLFTFTVANELGSQECSINAVFTREISPVSVHLNLGFETSDSADEPGARVVSAAFEYPFKKFDIVGEIGNDNVRTNWLIGTRWKVIENGFIGIGLRNNTDDSTNRYTVGFHVDF